jgi:hypothetical protein
MRQAAMAQRLDKLTAGGRKVPSLAKAIRKADKAGAQAQALTQASAKAKVQVRAAVSLVDGLVVKEEVQAPALGGRVELHLTAQPMCHRCRPDFP